MDYNKLRESILGDSRCSDYIITNDMPKDSNYYIKDSKIAEIFNSPSGTRLVDRYENAVGLMSALGAITAATILEKLESAKATIPALKWAMMAMNSDPGINLGDPETQVMIDSMLGILTQEEIDLVNGLAIQESSLAYDIVGRAITASDVSIALRNY